MSIYTIRGIGLILWYSLLVILGIAVFLSLWAFGVPPLESALVDAAFLALIMTIVKGTASRKNAAYISLVSFLVFSLLYLAIHFGIL